MVELTGSACTFPGGTVGTDPGGREKKQKQKDREGKGEREGRDRHTGGGREKKRIVMR